MDAEPLGQVVRRLRLEADLTLEGLSEASGISARALSDIERGAARGPQHRTVLAIARTLDLTEADRKSNYYTGKGPRSLAFGPRGVLAVADHRSVTLWDLTTPEKTPVR